MAVLRTTVVWVDRPGQITFTGSKLRIGE